VTDCKRIWLDVKFQPRPLYKLKGGSFLLLIFHAFFGFSQSGSPGSPFTSLGQARTVSAGVYYFNISGASFSTYVSNGWILVANDSGGAAGILPTVTALSNSTRGVLAANALTAFATTPELNLTTSDGNVNVTSSNTALVHRLVFDSTLFMGAYGSDKTNNASWTGTGQSWVQGAGASCAGTSLGTHLDSALFWPCGDGNGFHWIPNGNYHRESWPLGEASSTVAFDLWAQAGPVLLPVIISSFSGTLVSNNTVELQWTMESVQSGANILVEKSSDGMDWSVLVKESIQAASHLPLFYSAADNNPNYGNNFYRLGEDDPGGNIQYSQTVVIVVSRTGSPVLFPNPARANATLKGQGADLKNIRVFSIIGQDLTAMVRHTKLSDNTVMLNFALLPKGIFYVKTASYSLKVVVE